MKNKSSFLISLILIFAFIFQALPCGPSYITPIFDFDNQPETPFENFAAGQIGIIKPSQRRVVLFAAYRYLNGGGFTAEEQRALVDVWKMEFNRREIEDRSLMDEAVRNWTKKRAEVFSEKEPPLPQIYVEREYGGYDFFPNCAKNAFETATKTLADRIQSYGADDPDVKDWVAAQDKVFTNCSSGRQIPELADETKPEWLRKDRIYQIAAAEFYSLDYPAAKRRFAEIAQDPASPWQDTADYLVGRVLIRQASLSKSEERSKILYTEAEQHLESVAARNAKYGADAEKLLGLVKYRLRPEERLAELAGKLTNQYGSETFRQDLIDFNWLMDKFEKEALEAEEKRKAENASRKAAGTDENSANASVDAISNVSRVENTNASVEPAFNDDKLKISLWSEDYAQNWTFYISPSATDEEAIAEGAKAIGRPLSDKMKQQIRDGRKYAYAERFSQNRQREYQGGYYGSEEITLSLVPDFMRIQDLTDWLFSFQIENAEAYLYALSKFKQTGSDLWLLTAISKAGNSSTEADRLLEKAAKVPESSPAFLTVAYHRARLLLERGKTAEARKLLDELLASSVGLPISARNNFLELRLEIADTLEDFLRFAQRRPYAFDWNGRSGTIDEIIAEQKSWYDPKFETKSREEYEKEVEESFAKEKLWQDRTMFDAAAIETMNNHFPTEILLNAQRSPALPDYLREQFALAIWTRAAILEDYATAAKIAPEVIKYKPELLEPMNRFLAAKTPPAKKTAALYLILKNPVLTIYLEDGLPRTDNEFSSFDSNDWWCAPYEMEYDEKSGESLPRKVPPKPPFLTQAQSEAAQAARKRLKEIGDAPKYLGEQTLAWAKRAPSDKRVPESLFIVWEANGWTKYGCGSNIELRQKIGDLLKKKYPDTNWAQTVFDEEKQQN